MKQSVVLLKEHDQIIRSSGNKTEIMDNQPKDQIQALFERSKDYVETRLELLKLQAVNKSSDVISSAASKMVVVVAMLFFFLILNIGLGLLIGDWLGESYWGFFILAGIYLITGLLFNANGKKWIKEPVSSKIIKKLFN